ncbi:MAG: PLP-dependent cysteine synthase family protein [Clostridiales bacterium]|nr:PLP-dependent cysteine synthase family protein [Clostridiales bacterium]
MIEKFAALKEKIGNTPLIRTKIDNVYAKLESENPAGSIKDRAALYMLMRAYKEGKLKEGDVVLEATSGNTGIGLAYIARELGIKCVLTMPETMTVQRRELLKSYGAEVILTPSGQGMKGAEQKASELEKEYGYYYVRQFSNPGNALAHVMTTAPEIFKQCPDVKWIVAGIGSGGTTMGIKHYINQNGLDCKVCGVEPFESPLLTKGVLGHHGIQGIGANFVPELLNVEMLDKIIDIKTQDAIDYVKWFYKSSKRKVGLSSGAVLAAAELVSEKAGGGKVVAVLADGGDRYGDELYKI